MNVSLGIFSIIVMFIYIIIPGYITRRFYFHGEFSKQINISSSPIVHIVYSSIVGIVVTFSFISLLNCSDSFSIKIDQLLINFKSDYLNELPTKNAITFNNNTSDTNSKTKISNKKDKNVLPVKDNSNEKYYTEYLPFIAFLYLISSVIGYFLSKIVIFYKFDTKYKFLRFDNDWHYVFNGKIFQFKKHTIPDVNLNLEVKYTYLNILIQDDAGEKTLYSGFLGDYDLCAKDNDKIERLHLLKATKNFTEKDGSVSQKNIPGNLFTLIGDKIVNINCVYICYNADEILIKKNSAKEKWFKFKSNFLFSYQILLLVSFIILSIFVLSKFELKNNIYNSIIDQSIFYRIVFLFTVNIFTGLLKPFKIDFKNKRIDFSGWHMLFLKFILIAFLYSFMLFAL